MSTRDELRQTLLATHKQESRIIEFFGQQVEIRQPRVRDILKANKAQQQEGEEAIEGLVDMLITYCFVPGTDERIFEIGDREALLNLPFSPDMSRMSATIAELTGTNLNLERYEKNSEVPGLKEQSSN